VTLLPVRAAPYALETTDADLVAVGGRFRSVLRESRRADQKEAAERSRYDGLGKSVHVVSPFVV
jgi:hypothetical protein